MNGPKATLPLKILENKQLKHYGQVVATVYDYFAASLSLIISPLTL